MAVVAVVAEAMVVADDKCLHADAPLEIALDEFAPRQGAEGAVERDDNHVVDAQLFEQRQFFVERCELVESVGTSQRDARMGVEREHDALPSCRAGLGNQPGEQSLMAEVYAVERPDRHGRLTETGQLFKTVEYPHRRIQPLLLLSSASLTK